MFQKMLQIGTSIGTTGIVPLVPRMKSNNTWGTLLEGQVGGECKSLNEYHVDTYRTYKAFDYDDNTRSSDNLNLTSGQFIEFDFLSDVMVDHVIIKVRANENVRIEIFEDNQWKPISDTVSVIKETITSIKCNVIKTGSKFRAYKVSGEESGFDTYELQFYGSKV